MGCPLKYLYEFARVGHPVTHDPGVERIACMNMGLAEIGIAKRIALSERLRTETQEECTD